MRPSGCLITVRGLFQQGVHRAVLDLSEEGTSVAFSLNFSKAEVGSLQQTPPGRAISSRPEIFQLQLWWEVLSTPKAQLVLPVTLKASFHFLPHGAVQD